MENIVTLTIPKQHTRYPKASITILFLGIFFFDYVLKNYLFERFVISMILGLTIYYISLRGEYVDGYKKCLGDILGQLYENE